MIAKDDRGIKNLIGSFKESIGNDYFMVCNGVAEAGYNGKILKKIVTENLNIS